MLVSVVTISFLSAGLITLIAGVGIIFGTNIGTTTGAWLVAGFGLMGIALARWVLWVAGAYVVSAALCVASVPARSAIDTAAPRSG